MAADELGELRRLRDHRLRLTADRALGTIDDAVSFLDEVGMFTRTADSALPSLFEACHERPYREGGKGFASWPATKWWWAGALPDLPGVNLLKIHSGKGLYLSDRVLAIADPICRSELARMESERADWGKLLGYLGEVGPTDLSTIQEELGLTPKELKALRHPLERCGALVARSVVEPGSGGADEAIGADSESHLHTSVLYRFDQAHPTPVQPVRPIEEAVGDLLVTAVDAAVVAHRTEVAKWFGWRHLIGKGVVESLAAAGRITLLGDQFVASTAGS